MRIYHLIIKILNIIAILAVLFYVSFLIYAIIQAEKQIIKKLIYNNGLPINNSKDLSIKMLFFGDMMLDRYVGERIDEHGLDYLFANLSNRELNSKALELSSYDLIACNLEGAITNNGDHYDPQMSYDFAFAPELINELKNYNFNFFNLANNHFADEGERGIIETRQNLDKLEFNYSGCADGKIADYSSTILEINNKKIGLAGFSMVYSKLDEDKMNQVIYNLASTTDIQIINIHWGVEYEHQFNKTQQQVAHNLIEAGADIIIGHHPHVVQGMEIYQEKPIFYSLGNFIFDQYFSPATQEGLAVEINFIDNEAHFLLRPFKSKSSQVELINEEQRNEFLNKFMGWSKIKDNLIDNIKKGEFYTPI